MKIRKDRFRKTRGGSSQVYNIICSNCENSILRYQKDGIGTLIRLYIDRIIENQSIKNTNLVCSNCKSLIGIPMRYKPEDREAFRLIRGSFKKIKLNRRVYKDINNE